ncbi:hypothetical protein MY4824_008716 [Beauveria thailandica]
MCRKRQGVDLWKARGYMCAASSVAEAAFEAQCQDSRAAAGNQAGNAGASVTQGEKRHRCSPSASHGQRFFWLDPGGTVSASLIRANREALHLQHTEQAVKEVEGVGGFLLPRELHGQGTDNTEQPNNREADTHPGHIINVTYRTDLKLPSGTLTR